MHVCAPETQRALTSRGGLARQPRGAAPGWRLRDRTSRLDAFAALALHHTSTVSGRVLTASSVAFLAAERRRAPYLASLTWLGDLQPLPQDTDSEDELPLAPAVAVAEEVAPPPLQARAEGGRVRA